MEKPIFYIVDVFAEEKFTGNQLAVFRFVKTLSTTEMQQIAKEMNYSETTFVLSDEKQGGGYNVRIFTPFTELPFAGHPTLGTAFVIQHEIIKKPIHEVILNLKAGQIPVMFSYTEKNSNILWMKQLKPIFGDTFDSNLISEILNLNVRDISETFPVQEVSTGLPVVLVPIKTLDAVKSVRIDRTKSYEFMKNLHAKTLLIFCPETYKPENDLNVRFFADQYGIPEDPATGSANGCLAAYLVKHRYFGKDKIDIRVEQGYEIGRQSLLLLRAEEDKQKIVVYIGGKVKMIAKGEFI